MGAAKAGLDPLLAEIVDTWPWLPDDVREQIAEAVRRADRAYGRTG